jgi:EXLDI family protein
MPNKTIYVAEDDLPLFARAQEIAGGSLSAAISAALRRYVDIEEGREEGFDEVILRVGAGRGRKQRFSGVLLGEWGRSTNERTEVFRVYRSRSGRFVLHVERSEAHTDLSPNAERWNTGWRAWVGNWSADQTWGVLPAEATLHVADTLDELRDLLPPELYDMVADAAAQPTIEDLDI